MLRKPPGIILHRMITELNAQTDRYRAPRRVDRFDETALLRATAAASVEELWDRLAGRVYAIPIRFMSELDYERVCPGDALRIFEAADAALAGTIDLLGTGPVRLGTPIDWHRDFKTGVTWPLAFMRDINYTNLGSPSDVKVPWEVSRLQWLIPAGQAFLLTRDERYAEAVRAVLEDWIAANPYAHGVNWTCTMEAAMRIHTWTWFFHVFCRSRAWADDEFQRQFLRVLFMHGEFTERYIERSDINGNHFTADAAALVFAGLFFGTGDVPRRWSESGWRMLCDELPRQVHGDGVDFEASVAYHRLVLELFFFAARYREALGLPVSDEYRHRVTAMATFALAYSRPDGTSPLVGDADDARVLPFGGEPISDHRYIAGLVGAHWCVPELMNGFTGSRAEVLWTLGRNAVARLHPAVPAADVRRSVAFADAGVFVMQNRTDHVFVDCGPVGQAGRGGHGHNDCLSFEAALDGVRLVTDCGAYLYTANAAERNRFRSTAYHNTPQIDGEEINRFVRWDHLWSLHDDATPEVRQWTAGPELDELVASHTGYLRLSHDIRPVRRITLAHRTHELCILDDIQGSGDHDVTIPLHLAPGVEARIDGDGRVVLVAGARTFVLRWSSDQEWTLSIGSGRVSPSYGVVFPIVRLVWRHAGPLPSSLQVSIVPALIG